MGIVTSSVSKGLLSMKITTLIENTCPGDQSALHAEHGLSLHIHSGEKRILFDTGISGAFVDNARRLGIDLGSVNLAVLSHHHFDHGGGLGRFMQVNSQAPIYLRPPVAGEARFRAFAGLINRPVGLAAELFQEQPQRFHFLDEAACPATGVFILTDIEKLYPTPKGNRYLVIQQNGQHWPDDFRHELILVVQEPDGLVIFTGCSHNGVLNMLSTVVRQFPGQPIKALVGGFHQIGLPILNNLAESKANIRSLGQHLLQSPIARVYTAHCTGLKAYPILKEVMGERLDYLPTGSQIDL
jgi:7,8-dihydropterin-6-yl-methyl-4-(beta-D-ribofuranosyl)aminobenzene 5'-phosphate synthase